MNRQMFIGGVDPLTKYTDMNLRQGLTAPYLR